MIKVYDRSNIQDLSQSENLSDIVDISYNFYEDLKKLYCEVFIQYSGDPELDTTHAAFQAVIDKEIYRGQIIMVTLLRESDIGDKFNKIVYSSKYNKLFNEYIYPRNSAKFNAVSIWIPYNVNYPILVLPQIRTKVEGNRVEGLDYEEIELLNDNEPQITLLSLAEGAQDKKDLWLLKKQFVGDLIDPYDTITYLEGQVDVLSKIINMLIEKTGLDVGEYKDILKSIDDNNVISVKPLERINSEIITTKNRIRQIQKEYFIERYGD